MIEKDILNRSKTLSDLARAIFGKENYTNREKCKKLLSEDGIDWKEWIRLKKKSQQNIASNAVKN